MSTVRCAVSMNSSPAGTRTSPSGCGGEILAAYKAAFGEDGLEPSKIDVKRLDSWLRDFKPSKRANIAAPGLSPHGRASAIDFQVMKEGRIYAGADSKQVESVWRAEGWDKKLKASMEAAGPSFSGPLTNPDEPWHYDYAPPDAAVGQKKLPNGFDPFPDRTNYGLSPSRRGRKPIIGSPMNLQGLSASAVSARVALRKATGDRLDSSTAN